jgi:hypothetical protein
MSTKFAVYDGDGLELNHSFSRALSEGETVVTELFQYGMVDGHLLDRAGQGRLHNNASRWHGNISPKLQEHGVLVYKTQ